MKKDQTAAPKADPKADPTARDAHFEFGANWANFATTIDAERVKSAVECLGRLVGGDLAGQDFFDIGSGSGLSSLAALKLGAREVIATDIDENAVATTRALLTQQAEGGPWRANLQSVFDLDPAVHGTHDVVHSWGVLHHTGDMNRAIERAAALVRPRGRLVLAIYNRTPLCGFWEWEKRIYTHGPRVLQPVLRGAFMAAFLAYLPATDFHPIRFVREYGRGRGMRWSNDVHDWLGGYPYTSATPEEITSFVGARGFTLERQFLVGRQLGLWGSGCNEFVFRRGE